METALSGVRILDLTRALAGPYCAMILGDLGAEMIKIEAVGGRNEVTGQYSYKGQDGYFMSVNRSKKSLTLDIRTDTGREVFYELVKVADVVLDNFRPGVLERLKVDYDTLKALNPGIICASISGFGTTGPYRDRPAYDLVVQAISGAMSITGEPGRPPVRSGIAIGDQGAGMFAAHGVLAALYARERAGQGQKVETSLLESTVAQLAYEASLYFISGAVPGPVGSGHRTLPVYGAFETADGYVAIAAIGRYPHLCRAIDRADLVDDPRFQGRMLVENRDEFLAILREAFLTRNTAEWLERLTEADVPNGPVNTLDEALADPQVLARDMVVSVEHNLGGHVMQTGNPIKMSATPPEERLRFLSPPPLGEHTDEILSTLLGYTPEKIDRLRQEKVI
jgi:crotonobetainyl-CoA:carnitine CoA-transferase CaiB-like acyl-CoA transferase